MSKVTTLYPIVKPVLPSINKYAAHIEGVFKRNWLTNNGPLLQELEIRLADYLNVENLLLVSNGTLALQVAYAALNVSGKVLTTPFSFAATASSLCWQKLTPHFVDINPLTFNLELSSSATPLNEDYSAIVGVHVFGNPCEIEQIDDYAQQHSLNVIYDAAHAFGSEYRGQSLLSYGDAATISLHATKLFHCVEGGAIVFKDKDKLAKARQMINFGFDVNGIPDCIGINAKMSEMHAAMGLTMLDVIDDILDKRQNLVAHYQKQLAGVVNFQQWHVHGNNNGAYMPVLFQSEAELNRVSAVLTAQGIQNRRYFYPSLAEVSAYDGLGDTPIANDISRRVLCLPLYFDLSFTDVEFIANAVKTALLKQRRD